MPHDLVKHWPFDVLPPERRSGFHRELIALFEAVHAAGYSAYTERSETLIGFGSRDRRAAEFVLRSSRNRYWEPFLMDRGKGVRLGPLFGFSESKCMVLDSISDVATFTLRWLGGVSLEDAIGDLSVFDRMDATTPLRLNA